MNSKPGARHVRACLALPLDWISPRPSQGGLGGEKGRGGGSPINPVTRHRGETQMGCECKLEGVQQKHQ